MAMAGALIGVVSSLASGVIGMAQANAQAQAEEDIAAYNAETQRREASWAQAEGAQESAEVKDEGDKQQALARAAAAQSGTKTDEGTPLLLEQNFASETLYRENTTMANATKNERDMLNRSKITKYEGEMRANATRSAGMASLIGGVSKGIGGLAKGFG